MRMDCFNALCVVKVVCSLVLVFGMILISRKRDRTNMVCMLVVNFSCHISRIGVLKSVLVLPSCCV